MKAKHVFIQPETDAALSKLGGANRAENLRRAVALAECADELAEALGNIMASLGGRAKECGHDFDCVCPEAKAAATLTKYRSAKQ